MKGTNKILAYISAAVALAVLVAGCSPSRPAAAPTAGQGAFQAGQGAQQATRTPGARPTQALAAAGPTATPAIAPTAVTLATLPPPTPVPSATPAAAAQPSTGGAARTSVSSAPPAVPIPYSAPSFNPNKYPAPVLTSPDDNSVWHVSQPVIHFTWTNTPSDLLTFGESPQCTSDATYFRHLIEVNQIVIHNLDGAIPDIVGWMDTGQDYNLNLTTVPAGRYSWSVNVGVICQSHLIGQAYDLPQHKSTMERQYLAPVSPSSGTRTFTWIP